LNGSVKLTLELIGLYPCGDISDSLIITITPLPAQGSRPDGPEELCQNAGSTLYATTPIEGASAYQWILNPAEAGILTISDTSLSVEWAAEYWGTAEISVYGINDCGEGQVSEPLEVTLLPLPLQPAAPIGDTYVCVNFVQTSDYVTAEADFATSYEWSITPQEAGIITGSDTTGTVTWNNQWTGAVQIAVRGLNDCGEGIWSETIEVIMDICGGLDEKTDIRQIAVFPNPSSGTFTLRMTTTRESLIGLKVLNAMNSIVYEKRNIPWSGTQEMEIQLQGVTSGTYFLYLENNDSTLVRKVMIR
jgi:hypothetical protein